MLPFTCCLVDDLEIEFFETVAAEHHHPRLFRVSGIDEHALGHSGVTPERVSAAARKSAGGATPVCEEAGGAWSYSIEQRMDIGHGGSRQESHDRLRVPTIRVAWRCDPARRQTCCRSFALASQCPTGRDAQSTDGGFSHLTIYRGRRPATMASSRGGDRHGPRATGGASVAVTVASFACMTQRLDDVTYLEFLEWPHRWRIRIPRTRS